MWCSACQGHDATTPKPPKTHGEDEKGVKKEVPNPTYGPFYHIGPTSPELCACMSTPRCPHSSCFDGNRNGGMEGHVGDVLLLDSPSHHPTQDITNELKERSVGDYLFHQMKSYPNEVVSWW